MEPNSVQGVDAGASASNVVPSDGLASNTLQGSAQSATTIDPNDDLEGVPESDSEDSEDEENDNVEEDDDHAEDENEDEDTGDEENDEHHSGDEEGEESGILDAYTEREESSDEDADEDEDDVESAAPLYTKKKSLDLLPGLPLDLLFEIFSHLPPIDIFSVARISKAFRKMIMTPMATTMWKTARERIGAPSCPDWMNELDWVALLVGIGCQTCGGRFDVQVDFRLMRRSCRECRSNHIIDRKRFQTQYLRDNAEMLDLVRYTGGEVWVSGRLYRRRLFWAPDVDAMIVQLAPLEKAVSLYEANASEMLDEFKETQKARIRFLRQNAPAWKTWLLSYNKLREEEADQKRKKRLEQVVARFQELGYKENDLSFLHHRVEMKCTSEITNSRWRRLRLKLEPDARASKQQRLEREAAEIRRQRRVMVDRRYAAYRRTLPPSQWKYLPRTLNITFLQPFLAVVETDIHQQVTEASFDEAFDMLPDVLAAKSMERREMLCAVLPTTDPAQGGDSSTTLTEVSSSVTSPRDPLDLVTAVFECKEPRRHRVDEHDPYLFGWDEVASHDCTDPGLGLRIVSPPVTFSPVSAIPAASGPRVEHNLRAAKAVAKVLAVAGLKEDTTAAEMDNGDAIFECSKCPKDFRFEKGSYRHGYSWFSYTWRSMVVHLVDAYLHNPMMEISLVSPAKLKKSKLRTPKPSWAIYRLWTCGKCSKFMDDLQGRDVIVQHLRDSHGVSNPSDPDDLFLYQRFRPHLQAQDRYTNGAPSRDLS